MAEEQSFQEKIQEFKEVSATVSPEIIAEQLKAMMADVASGVGEEIRIGKKHQREEDDVSMSASEAFKLEGSNLAADVNMLKVATAGLTMLEDKLRMNSELPARATSPAGSSLRLKTAEAELFDAMARGDDVSGLLENDSFSFTAHPNFGLSEEMAEANRAMIRALMNLDKDQLNKLGGNVKASDEEKKEILENLEVDGVSLRDTMEQAVKNLNVREKRTRYKELQEATTTFVPDIMRNTADEVAAFKARAYNYAAQSENKDNHLGNFDRKNTIEDLEKMAATTASYNSWFPDGDGKRTSHAWDAEVAVPAIKRSTLEEYVKGLDRVAQGLGEGTEQREMVERQREEIAKAVEKLQEIELAANDRMIALSKMQDQGGHAEEITRRQSGPLGEASRDANEHENYYEKLDKKVLTHDYAGEVKDVLKKLKEAEAKGEIELAEYKSDLTKPKPILDDEHKVKGNSTGMSEVDALYVNVEKHGNFAVKLQRRENAFQNKQTMRTVLGDGRVKDIVSEYLAQYDEQGLKGSVDKAKQYYDGLMHNDRFSEILEVVTDILSKDHEHLIPNRKGDSAKEEWGKLINQRTDGLRQNIAQDEGMAAAMLKAAVWEKYNEQKNRIEHKVVDRETGEPTGDRLSAPAAAHNSLLVDDLGYFHMAKLYPEAFNSAGTIIAEYATPSEEVLKSNNDELIRQRVADRALDDMRTAHVFNDLMGADIPVIPLSENPKSIQFREAADEAVRNDPYLQKRMLATSHIDVDNPNIRQSLRENEKGEFEIKPLTMYDMLEQSGISEERMRKNVGEGKDADAYIKQLQETFVVDSGYSMYANSDNTKQAGLAGAVLTDSAVQQELMVAAREDKLMDLNGQKIAMVNETYLGQGGSFMRTTGSRFEATQATVQGDHANMMAGTLGHAHHNRKFARLEDRVIESPDVDVSKNFAEEMANRNMPQLFNIANQAGVKGVPEEMREGFMAANRRVMDTRIRITRDDPVVLTDADGNKGSRYDSFMNEYGEAAANYSARPDAKGGKKGFGTTRAIGVAAKEAGIFSNIIALAEKYEFDDKGKLTNLEEAANWMIYDSTEQQNISAATMTLAIMDVSQKWQKRGIEVEGSGQDTMIVKDGEKIALKELAKAYDDNKAELQVGGTTFDGADLVMGKLHDQANRLEQGIIQTIDLIEGVQGNLTKKGGSMKMLNEDMLNDEMRKYAEAVRETSAQKEGSKSIDDVIPNASKGLIDTYKEQFQRMMGIRRDLEEKASERDLSADEAHSYEMARDVYYTMLESGPLTYPPRNLVELAFQEKMAQGQQAGIAA